MPLKNDYVNYSTHGICRVEEIRFMQFDRSSKGREYYILRPVHPDNIRIFVPMGNPHLAERMRPVLSPVEIDQTILSVKNQTLQWIDDCKQRAAMFRKILLQRDERELLLLVSCLYLKSREGPKALSASDVQILKAAEEIIEQEFSFSLKISTQQIGSYIREKLGLAKSMGA